MKALFLFMFIFPIQALSDESASLSDKNSLTLEKVENAEAKEMPSKGSPEPQHESFYWGFTLGTGSIFLGNSVKNNINSIEQTTSEEDYSYNVASRIFVYWPVSEKILLGISSGGAIRSITLKNEDNIYAGVSVLSGSLLYSLTGHPAGSGLQVRGNFGFGVSIASKSAFDTENSDSGSGGAIAFGYRMETTPGTRMTFEIEYGTVNSSDVTSYLMLVGGVIL